MNREAKSRYSAFTAANERMLQRGVAPSLTAAAAAGAGATSATGVGTAAAAVGVEEDDIILL
jgi:hypothetical protein